MSAVSTRNTVANFFQRFNLAGIYTMFGLQLVEIEFNPRKAGIIFDKTQQVGC